MKNSDQPAFPLPIHHKERQEFDGLTIRQYAAIKAMQGILANGYPQYMNGNIPLPVAEMVAKESILYADILLTQLEK